MRWFKHMVGSGQDEKLIILKDEFGMEGYGVYWSILEHIAAQINKENQQTFLELSPKSWRKVTDYSPKKLQNFLKLCSEISLFSVEYSEKKIKIDCRNILKYKDEYTRKSGQTPVPPPQNSPPKSGATPEEETETDKEAETDKDKELSPKERDRTTADELARLFIQQFRNVDQPDREAWAQEVFDMRVFDSRKHKEIIDLFRWAVNDEYWRKVIHSPAKLRRNWTTIQIQKSTGGTNGSNGGRSKTHSEILAEACELDESDLEELQQGSREDGVFEDASDLRPPVVVPFSNGKSG